MQLQSHQNTAQAWPNEGDYTGAATDTAYVGSELSKDARYRKKFGASKLAEALAAYARSNPEFTRVITSEGT